MLRWMLLFVRCFMLILSIIYLTIRATTINNINPGKIILLDIKMAEKIDPHILDR